MNRNAIVLILCLISPLVCRGADLQKDARELLCNPFVASGDAVGEVEFYVDFALKHKDSPLCELALHMARNVGTAKFEDPHKLDASLEKLSESVAPYAADVAARIRQKLLLAGGDFSAAGKVYASRGCVPSWRVAGPFGKFAHASFYSVFEPEMNVSPDAVYDGVRGEVKWRVVDSFSGDNMFDPWNAVYPRNGVVYMLARYRADNAAEAMLHVNTACVYKVFAAGKSLAECDRFAGESAVERYYPLSVAKGDNYILLKMYAISAARGVEVRLLDKSAKVLRGIVWGAGGSMEPDKNLLVGSGAPVVAGEDVSGLVKLRSSVKAQPESSPLNGALAMYSLLHGLYDDALHYARAAVAGEKDSPYWQLVLARCELEARHLTAARRQNKAREAFELALEKAPGFVPALLGVARYKKERERHREAVALCDRVLAINPACLSAYELKVRIAIDNGWLEQARKFADSMKAKSSSLSTYGVMALVAASEGNFGELEAAYGAAVEKDWGALPLRVAWANSLARLGDFDRAEKVLRAYLSAFPENVDLAVGIAKVCMKAGRFSAAEKVLDDYADKYPHYDMLLTDLGDARFCVDDVFGAIAAYSKSLADRPDQHMLRRLLSRLDNSDYAFWTPYEVDSINELKKAAYRKMAGGTARVVDQTVITVYPDGSYSNYTHEVQKVLSDGGVDEAGSIPLYGEMLEARTILQNGSAVEPVYIPGKRELTMPAVKPGVAVEYKYLDESKASFDKSLRFPKWYFRSPDSQEEFLLSQYVVRMPKGYPFAYASRNLDGRVDFLKNSVNGWDVYIWTARDMPRAIHEEGAPHIDEMLPFIEIATRRSWEDVNRIFMNMYLGRVRKTRGIVETIAKVCRKAAEPREVAEKLYRFVCRDIDEVRTDAGASHILEQRAGDRVVLLLALLRAAGIDASYVVARPSEKMMYEPNWSIAQVGHFPLRMVLAVIDGKSYWLDTRYRSLGFGELVDDTAGATAFIVGKGKGEFVVLPFGSPEGFDVRESKSVKLAATDSPVIISGRREVRGSQGHMRIAQIERSDKLKRIEMVEADLASVFPAVTVLDVKFSNMDSSGKPFVEEYSAEASMILRKLKNGRLALPLCLSKLDILPDEDDDPRDRMTPYHMRKYVVGEDEVNVSVPDGVEIERTLQDVLLQTSFGYYRLSVKTTPSGISMNRKYRFMPQRISVKDYPAFAAMARDIARVEAALIEMKALSE